MPKEVSKSDFKLLLKLLYPAATPSFELNSFMTGELVHLAKLLKRWGFHDLLKAIFKEIESEPHISVVSKLPLAHLVLLGRELSCPAWICSGYMFLVGRKKPLTTEEATINGKTSAEVVKKLRRKHLGRKPVNVDAGIVIEAFPEELNMDAVRNQYL
ncbi:hypothetical protein CPB83DRAFT_910359 [Crepidotus variabilis]|uniref:BTB domain-containing protein n=1 Tax=Crepidotus variabilis TaxID=179855 RepID=A0A9P6E7A1_9AGAR|nr:hypothetical protein CPB83DRAFT_910359 [Crepidotus variabilis]